MLSNTADYALRALLVLARGAGGQLLRADEIADAIGAPRNYLSKTLNTLAKAGIVTSTRGRQGGFALAQSPRVLTVARVVDLFDEPRHRPRCMLGNGPCDPLHPCVAHDRWTALTSARRTPLATTTLADLLGWPDARAESTRADLYADGASVATIA